MSETRRNSKGAGDTGPENDLKRCASFHGHVCPGLAYGVRVARAALERLGRRAEDEELVAVVETDSCSVDAIQVLMGCTFGKGNLVFRDTGKSVFTFFRRGGTDREVPGLRIAVDFHNEESPADREVWARFRNGDTDPDVARRVRELKSAKIKKILEVPEEDLLRITPVDGPPPARARIYTSVRCVECGEKVMEPRARLREGSVLCGPCFEKI